MGPAVNLNTVAREEDPSLGVVSSMVALKRVRVIALPWWDGSARRVWLGGAGKTE